jgi:DNA-binding NarL/FixJ family response regulator
MQDETKRLVLADDHHLLRRGFRSLLSGEPGLEVVGEASTGLEAIEICRRLVPDLVLMDVRMPEMDGITATRQIKRDQPGVSVLMVTMHENPDYLLEALDAGAAGYVLKDAPAKRLINAVRRTLEGESPLNQELATRLLRQLAIEQHHKLHPRPSGRREPLDGADAPRDRSPRTADHRADQPADRADPDHKQGDGQGARGAHNPQARGLRPHPGGGARYRTRLHFSRYKTAISVLK